MLTPLVAQIAILAYSAAGLVLISSPVLAAALFILVRSVFQVGTFKGYTVFNVLPLFTLPFLVILVTAVWTWLQSNHRSSNNRIIFYYYIYIALAVFSYLANIHTAGSPVEAMSKLLAPALIYTIVYFGIRSEKDVERGMRLIVYTSIIPISAGLYQYLTGGGYNFSVDDYVPGFRMTGTIVDPNLYGIYLTLILCFCISLAQWGKASKVMVLYLLIILLTIVLARNRGTWIALAGAMVIAVWCFRRNLNIRYWVIGGLVTAVCSLPVVLSRFQQLDEYDQYGQKQDTFSERLNHHGALLEKSLDSPIIGFGFDSATTPLEGTTQMVLAHNDYVRSAVEVGYIGVIFYVIFLLSQFNFCLNNRSNHLWGVQFGAFIMQAYVIIISFSQNFVADILSYSIFLFMLAVSHRCAELVGEYAEGETHVHLSAGSMAPAFGNRRIRRLDLRSGRR